MCVELVLECSEDATDECIVTVARERVIGEHQQPVVGSAAVEPASMAAKEVRDVVGHDGASFVRGVIEKQAIVDSPQVLEAAILNRRDIMAARAQLVGHRRGDHLVEQQPHWTSDCSAS